MSTATALRSVPNLSHDETWRRLFSDSSTEVAFTLSLTKAQTRLIRQIVKDDAREGQEGAWRKRHYAQYVSVESLVRRGIAFWRNSTEPRSCGRNLLLTPAGKLIAQLIAFADGDGDEDEVQS